MQKLSIALSLSLFAACTTSAPDEVVDDRSAELARPSDDVVDYAARLAACDPELATTLQQFVDGDTSVRSTPSAACTGSEDYENSRAQSCFSRAWNFMGYTERAACLAVGLPTCWTIFCSGLI